MKKTRFKSVREYVESQPRRMRQYEIARDLGVNESRLSRLLRGYPPTKNEVAKLRDHGIEVSV